MGRGRRPSSKHTHERTRNTNFVGEITKYPAFTLTVLQYTGSSCKVLLLSFPGHKCSRRVPCWLSQLADRATGKVELHAPRTHSAIFPTEARRPLRSRLPLRPCCPPAAPGPLRRPALPSARPGPSSRPVYAAQHRKYGQNTAFRLLNFEKNKTNRDPRRSGYGTAVWPRRRRR